jgi:DNA-binding CsgD family transcriptional regulator
VAPDVILGREEELATIARFFEDDRSGPGALLLEGEAGIGKTTLWSESLRLAQANGLVLSCRASEAETRLSFTVLGDLLAPVLDRTLEDLPEGQRGALEAALLLGPPVHSRPDARAVSVAVLAVLRSLASERPVTIAIDDVQWTDTPSARTLVFALRRLNDQPLSVVATRRVAAGLADPLDLAATFSSDLARLALGPIAPGSLGRLLREHLGRHFAPPLVKRIHGASGGNPFFAVEIGRALGSRDPNPSPGRPLPVPSDLQALLRHRLSALSGPAGHVLLIAASCAQPTAALIEDAGGERSGIEEAEEAGVVVMRAGAVEFTHPLLASTVYSGATPRIRREVHANLARNATDLEERARHLALSVDGPDEDAAVALEEAAQQAVARGAQSAAAELYQLAAIVTPPGMIEQLRRRRTGVLGHLWAAGDVGGARKLIDRIAELGPGPGRAHTLYVMAISSWNDVSRVRGFLIRALEEVGGDTHTRAQILGELAWAALWACDPTSSISWADEALKIAEGLDDFVPLRTALSVRAMAGGVFGQDTTALLERAIALEGTLSYVETGSARISLGQLQMWAGALASARETLEVELDRRLEQGHETATWEVRADLAEVEYRAGCLDLAAAHARKALDIVVETGWSEVAGEILPVQGAIAGAKGDAVDARAFGNEALSVCERLGDRWSEIQARSALGFLELSLGEHAACHAWLDPLVGRTEEMGLAEPGAFPFVPDEVEALVGLGELEAATRLTDRLEEQGRNLDRPLALATAARCYGLIAGARRDLTEAQDHLQRAVGLHRAVPQPVELGRTLLIKGEVERRAKRKRDARTSLGQALAIFEELGARLWAERARGELDRVGALLVGSAVLTSTEQRVAELAAKGRTNRQIADELFVSVKTVEANISRVLHKLGVRSRRDLRDVLDRGRDDGM